MSSVVTGATIAAPSSRAIASMTRCGCTAVGLGNPYFLRSGRYVVRSYDRFGRARAGSDRLHRPLPRRGRI